MTSDDLAGVLIGAASILAVIAIATLGGVIRMSIRWGHIESKLQDVAVAVAGLRGDMDREHADIYGVIREDRRATNDRLTRVEAAAFRPVREGEK